MISNNKRYKPNQSYAARKFNNKVNKIKSVNKITNQRGGIKL